MSRDENREGPEKRFDSNREDAAGLAYIVSTYNVTLKQARDVIAICGCADRAKIDTYMREQGRRRRKDFNNRSNFW